MKRRLWEVSVIVLVVIAIWRGVIPMLNTTGLDNLDLRGLDLRESTFAGKTLTRWICGTPICGVSTFEVPSASDPGRGGADAERV